MPGSRIVLKFILCLIPLKLMVVDRSRRGTHTLSRFRRTHNHEEGPKTLQNSYFAGPSDFSLPGRVVSPGFIFCAGSLWKQYPDRSERWTHTLSITYTEFSTNHWRGSVVGRRQLGTTWSGNSDLPTFHIFDKRVYPSVPAESY